MKLNYTYLENSKIGNYYGGIILLKHENKYYWLIEDSWNNFDSLEEYEEIPKELYDMLINLNKLKK